MHRDVEPQQLKVLVVTEDRALDGQVSRFLDTVGYQVLQAAESQSAIAAVESRQPHLLLIGADLASRNAWELLQQLSDASDTELYAFLMAEEPDDSLVQEAFEAGCEDILLLPLDYGELLSRLRAAARVIEFDRRAAQRRSSDPATGLLSRSALVAEIRRELAERVGSSSPRVACIALDIDYLGRIRRSSGSSAVEALQKGVAQELSKLRSGSEMLASLGTGRFAAILPGATDTNAVEWAEHARRAIAAARFKHAEQTLQVTASFGVAGCDAAESAEQLVEQAIDALLIAKSSGRNCIVRYGEFASDVAKLSGNMFERTVARDVMTPCTVLLAAHEPLSQAAAMFERTQLEGIPVVDADGTLVGLCEHDRVAAGSPSFREGRQVLDLMNADVQTFTEQETLISLLDFFARDARSMAIVLRRRQPVGYVTCVSLGALLQQVTTDTFLPESTYRDSSEYLLVSERCATDSDTT